MVEFIGAAGVGKTFLSDRVLEALRSRGMAARNFKLIEIHKAAPRNLIYMARAAFLSAMTRPKKPSLFVHAMRVIGTYSIRRARAEQLGGINVTCEGLFHKIITLHRNSSTLGTRQLADLLFLRIEPPDIVVVVEASAETIFARRTHRNRENDRFSTESVNADIAMVNESIVTMLHVQRTLKPMLPVVRIAAEEEGGDNAVAEIVAAIERHANTSAAASIARH